MTEPSGPSSHTTRHEPADEDPLSAHKQAALLAEERRLLKVIGAGSPLTSTLDALCRLAQEVDRTTLVSILLLDRTGKRIRRGGVASLPASYAEALDGGRVGLRFGPCSAAAHLGEQVISADIATDERWADEYKSLASAHGLRACWSTPIKSSQGRVLGTFAVYPSETTRPTFEQRGRIEQFTELASIAIEHAYTIDDLRRSEERYALAMEAASDGHMDWNLVTGEFYISPRMLKMVGHPPDATFVDRADWVRRFPFLPEDRPRWEAAMATHFASREAKFNRDFRIVLNGETRWLAFNFVATRDAAGNVLRWTGSVADINDRKRDIATVLDAIPGMVALLSPTAEVEAVNSELLAYLGQPLEVIKQWGTNGIVLPEDVPRVADVLRQAMSTGQPYEIEVRIRRFDGLYRWNSTRGLPFRDSSGAIVRWYAMVSDIDDRKHAETGLRESQQRYERAMLAAEAGFWDWDVPADDFYVSPKLLEMTDFPPGTRVAGRADFMARAPFHRGDVARWDSAVKELFATGGVRLAMEIRSIHGGKTRWALLSGMCVRDEAGKILRWTGSATDVTARKLAEEKLRSRQEMVNFAQKAAGAVAFEWRAQAGKDENRWSPELEALYGIASGSYDGTEQSLRKLIHAEDWPNVRAALKSALKSGDLDAEYRVIHPDGAIRWLQTKGRTLFDPGGEPARVVGFTFDITNRRLAAEELQRIERQLRHAQHLEALGTLAGGIAHDFNNLLGAILGYGEMALRNVRTGTRLRRDIESIVIAGERGHALVERILAFSRSGVGERVAVHVEKIVRETLALFAAKLPRHIVIERRLHAGSAAVMGDATQIHQVLMNLLTNAAQAMPSGGTLCVSVDRIHVQAPCVVTTGSIAAREYVVMEVSDSGSGIPAEILEKIFDPFFTTKEVGVGTGLGLSLVHGIVAGLGGAVDVATSLGKGSVFKVYLPRTGEVALPSKRRKRLETKTRRAARGHILVVDDEEILVRLATETLAELGYSPVGFTASGKALEAFLDNPEQFDAVITDESMPGASGSELIRRMRALRPTVPILLVSGYLSPAVIERAREAGATDVLKKPLLARDLQSALERVLRPTSSGRNPASFERSEPAEKQRRKVGASRSQRREQ